MQIKATYASSAFVSDFCVSLASAFTKVAEESRPFLGPVDSAFPNEYTSCTFCTNSIYVSMLESGLGSLICSFAIRDSSSTFASFSKRSLARVRDCIR